MNLDWWWVGGIALILAGLIGALLALWCSEKWWRD